MPSSFPRDRGSSARCMTFHAVVICLLAVVCPVKSSQPPVNTLPEISRFTVDGQEYKTGEPISLAPGSRRLEVHYAAVGVSVSLKTRFRFKLEGFDVGWVDAGTNRYTVYTNLPPGSYRFLVQADNDDAWSAEAELSFRIRPFFHQTVYFYVVLFFLGMAAIFGLYSFRVKDLKMRQKELELLADQRARDLKEAALRDPLTGLWNRRFVSEVFSDDLSGLVNQRKFILVHNSKRSAFGPNTFFGLYMIDIDHFRSVNDTFGPTVGDDLLDQFSRIIRETVRLEDLVVRWGGEEFLVILKNADKDSIPRVAQKFLQAVASHDFIVSGQETVVLRKTCSIGFSIFPFYMGDPERISFDQTINLIEMALLQAKKSGRNKAIQVFPTPVVPQPAEVHLMCSNVEAAQEKGWVTFSE